MTITIEADSGPFVEAVASLPKPSQEIVDSLIGAIKSGAQVVRLDLDLRVCQEINSTSLGDFVLYWSWCITAISSAGSVRWRPSWTSGCGAS